MSSPLTVRPVTRDEHLAFASHVNASFLQTPAWAAVKPDWSSQSIGWYDGAQLVGTGLVLFRQVPRIDRYLAYLPEGPVIDWGSYDAADITAPLLSQLRQSKAFTVKIGPQVVRRRWRGETLKAAAADARCHRLGEVPADEEDITAQSLVEHLRRCGWQRTESAQAGFGDLQPRYVFQLPLAGRSLDDIFAGFNQQWRRNVRKADKEGVVVSQGDADQLADFHRIYVATAERDGFTPRPLAYFQQMWAAMRGEDADRIRLYLAHHDGDLLAATTWVRVNTRVWYSYGASSNVKRELRPSNAIQWRMIQDAHAAGASVYDLRGISDTLDENDPLFGLIRFKLGTGGEAVEYVGEWDYPLSRTMHKLFQLYLGRRRS